MLNSLLMKCVNTAVMLHKICCMLIKLFCSELQLHLFELLTRHLMTMYVKPLKEFI